MKFILLRIRHKERNKWRNMLMSCLKITIFQGLFIQVSCGAWPRVVPCRVTADIWFQRKYQAASIGQAFTAEKKRAIAITDSVINGKGWALR